MAGDDRERRDDLFEDLDKFFAPIRDVDFGEERGAREEPRREPERPAPAAPSAPAPAGGEDDPYSWLREDMEREARERAAERAASERAAAERQRAASEPPASPDADPRPLVDVEPGEPPIRVWGADDDAEPSRPPAPPRRSARAPEPDLPPASGGFFGEPSRADVEAAADYFAEAVRGEVTGEVPLGEPEIRTTGAIRFDDAEDPVASRPTEFGGIASLLGEIEGREAEVQPRRPTGPVLGAEGMAGPSWQDPTAIEVGSDEHRSPGRNVPLAAATGLGLAAIAIAALWLGPGWFAGLAAVAVIAGQGEWFQAIRRQGLQPATAIGMASAGLVLAAAYLKGESAMLAMLPLALTATFLWYMALSPSHRRDIAANVGTTMLGIVYVALLAGYALLILRMDGGEGLLMAVVGLTIAYDIAAFFSGYLWGSRPLAASISPRKSWEGALGGTAVAIAVAAGAVASTVPALDTIVGAAGLAVVVSVFAPIGDLAESLVKRDLGLKDMGNILPGHGGVLDRIDALLFVMPAAYLYLRIVGA